MSEEEALRGNPRNPVAATRSMAYAAVAATAVLALLVAAPSRGAEKGTVHEQMVKARQEWLAAGKPGRKPKSNQTPEFGTDSLSSVSVHAYEFQPSISNDLLLDDGNGYRFFGTTTFAPYLAAPVHLPTGVVIDSIKLSDCTVNDGDLVLGLWDNGANGEPNVHIVTLNEVGGGCGTGSASTNYLYTQTAHHPLYFVLFWATPTYDGTIKFNNAQVYYRRVVSPAPVNATFADVPTGDFGFQFIEALAASGITGGCGGGNYCPDSPVSRRQMAIFLAKALGLHWPF